MLVQISNYWAKIILFDGFLLILQRFLKIIKYHMRKYYIVAEHGFSVEAEESIFSFMTQYEPFLADKSTSKEVFNLHIHQTQKPIENFIEDYRQNEEDYTILFGHTTDEEYVLQFLLHDRLASWLTCPRDFSKGDLFVTGYATKFSLNNALMAMFAFSTMPYHTLLFHSAVVSHHGYMFLGVSGTGKSTHARLWLQHIEGSELINDDNPVVRVYEDGSAYVFGSPWSGKTPCYRNVKYPLGGIVKLKQAPANKIQRVKGIDSYIVIKTSASRMTWDRHLADHLYQTVNFMAQKVPIWFLECLPDEAAARLCQSTIEG